MLSIQKHQDLRPLLQKAQSIAVVGLSPKVARPSNMVARYLIEVGYTVIPVNPGHDQILGLACYPSLEQLAAPVDIVNIFRRSEDVLPIVEQAVRLGAGAVWMQQGVVNSEAAKFAERSGLQVVMDRCIKIDHQNLFSGGL